MHSAEWCRGAVAGMQMAGIDSPSRELLVDKAKKLLAEAEAREAGEPGTDYLMQILRDGQADHWAATCGSDEGGFQPSEWVLEAEKVLAGEYSGSGLAEQLAAAKSVCEAAARFCEEINEDTGQCDLDRLPDLHEALDKYEALVEQAEAARLAEEE